MHSKYIELFQQLAETTAASAEQVMDYDRKKGDEKGLATATSMREDFSNLRQRIKDAGDNYEMTKDDCAKLAVGSMIIVNQLQDRINVIKKAVAHYQTDIIPKLQDILNTCNTDEEVAEEANKKFIIEENK